MSQFSARWQIIYTHSFIHTPIYLFSPFPNAIIPPIFSFFSFYLASPLSPPFQSPPLNHHLIPPIQHRFARKPIARISLYPSLIITHSCLACCLPPYSSMLYPIMSQQYRITP